MTDLNSSFRSGAGLEVSDHDPTTARERGATLIIASAVLLVLLGMAGFAVDLGWLYSQRTEATKAAESAALAGVVHMPNPAATPWGPGAEAFDVARDVAKRKGYNHGFDATVTPLEIAGHPNRLRVDVSRDVNTFFMKVFGVGAITIDTTATAEQTPPLKIGSDEPQLGGEDEDFWVAINGTRRRKGSGDPFAPKCIDKLNHNCASTDNPEYRRPGYYYAIEVPPSEVGKSLSIEIFDGHHNNSDSDTEEYSGVDGYFELRFRLFAPDSTPAQPMDNTNVVCSRTFYYNNDDDDLNEWDPLSGCPVTAQLGVYVLEVDIIENGPDVLNNNNIAVSAFAIRALTNGNDNNDTAVFGLGSMSLWMPGAGSNPVFKIVKLEEFYAGTELILNLFDAGDLSGTAVLEITGELSNIDCDVRIRRANLTIKQDWGPDDGGANCRLDVSSKEYDNEWIDLRFDISPTYTCAIDCWVYVDFDFGSADPYERTTWSATINGLPVHLVP